MHIYIYLNSLSTLDSKKCLNRFQSYDDLFMMKKHHVSISQNYRRIGDSFNYTHKEFLFEKQCDEKWDVNIEWVRSIWLG